MTGFGGHVARKQHVNRSHKPIADPRSGRRGPFRAIAPSNPPAGLPWSNANIYVSGDLTLKRLKVAGLSMALGLVAATGAVVAVPAEAHTIGIHDNCTKLNKS